MWKSVGELGEAFEEEGYLLPATGRLSGRTLALHLQDGAVFEYRFTSATELVRTARGGRGTEAQRETYRATEIRPGVLFVDFIVQSERATATSLVLDLDRRICTALTGQLPTRAEAEVPLVERIRRGEDLSPVRVTLLSGAVDVPFTAETERHARTDELIGKRVEYTYSPTQRYEHVYLNARFYSWHCLAGSELGLADTDQCLALELGQRLYFFAWMEKIVPTLGAVVIDLEQMRTTGKLFGYRGVDFGAATNFPIGARARIVSAL
jgi:hypothetical protein